MLARILAPANPSHKTASPESDIVRTLLLPPPKPTVILDLDHTLIHSQLGLSTGKKFDFVVKTRIDGEIRTRYVLKRPGVDEFLEALAAMRFEIVVFTASSKESPVLDRLDKKSVISHRLYHDSCTEVDGRYAKVLSRIGRDLRRVVIVDDKPNAYRFQLENAIPIAPFIDDPADRELQKLVKFFQLCDCYEDVRDAVKIHLSK